MHADRAEIFYAQTLFLPYIFSFQIVMRQNE